MFLFAASVSGGLAPANAQTPLRAPNGCLRTPPSGRVVIPRCPRPSRPASGARFEAPAATITVGDAPTGAAVNPLTNAIYVVNSNDFTLSIINGGTNAVTTVGVPGTVPLPVGVAVNPVTGRVYVTNNIDETVDVFTGTGTFITTISDPSFSSPQGIAVNPITNRIYVANSCSCTGDTITVIDGNTNTVSHVTTVGFDPLVVAVNPVTNMIYAANSSSGTVSAINGATNVVTATITVTPDPEGIAVNPVTNTIYVTDLTTAQLTAINGATNVAGQPLTVGICCLLGIAINTATNIVYVADPGASQLFAVNGQTSAITQISNPTDLDGPYGIDVNPSTGLVYVTNASFDYVTVYGGIGGSPTTAPSESCSPMFLLPGASTTCTVTLNSPVPIGGIVTKTIIAPPGAAITGCAASSGGLVCGSQPNATTLNLSCQSFSGICSAGSSFKIGVSGASSAPLTQSIALTPPSGGAQVSFALTGLTGPVSAAPVSLVSSVNPSTLDQSVTFTATLTCAINPTGTVTFTDGSNTIGGPITVATGSAAFSTGSLSVGSHSVAATYNGDSNCGSSTSAALTQVVNQQGTAPAQVLPAADVPVAPGYCAPAVNAPPLGALCMPVPLSAQQNAAAAIAFCTSVYTGIATQQACIASLIPGVGGFISLFGSAAQPPKPAPHLPGRYCTNPDGSQIWVTGGAGCP